MSVYTVQQTRIRAQSYAVARSVARAGARAGARAPTLHRRRRWRIRRSASPKYSQSHTRLPAGPLHRQRARCPTKAPTELRGRRSRPLRVESKDLAFVTSRTQNSAFFLHPLMCSRLVPTNRQAARVIAAKRARLDARFARLIKRANQHRPDSQPQLTLEEARLIAENLINSCARASAGVAAEGKTRFELLSHTMPALIRRDVLRSQYPRPGPGPAITRSNYLCVHPSEERPPSPRLPRSQ